MNQDQFESDASSEEESQSAASEPSRPRLKVQKTDWAALEQHLKRGGLILVDTKLDLLHVARAVVEDDQKQVAEWINQVQLRRPDLQEIETFRKSPQTEFQFVIAQPYVLIQKI